MFVSVACTVFYSSLDLYARNMADHHLVTDLLPPLARLFFLGHLNGAATTAQSDGGSSSSSSSSESGLSLSMVQKALLLGVGLQHRSVDDLALELNLPASQVKHQARISTQHSSEKRIPDPLQHSGRQSDKGRSFARGLMTIQKKTPSFESESCARLGPRMRLFQRAL